ncbi:MAG: hypothetical protein R2875_09475 [Desulfobacterales bacterium]
MGIDDIIIGIEENKPEAIEAIRKSAQGTDIKIAVLKTKYPQGSETPDQGGPEPCGAPGRPPADIGVAVSNVPP